MVLIALFICLIISSTCYGSNKNDFCVADLKAPESPSGYPCKPPDTVTVDDFVSNFKNSKTAYVTDIPGLNGLNLAAALIEIGPRDKVALHTHADAAEMLIVTKGEIIAGFFTIKSAFVTTLLPGQILVVPKGLAHFAVNASNRRNATVITTYSTSYPIFQYLNDNLFSNKISSDLIAQATYLDVAEVQKLKKLFGGQG